MEQPQLPAQPPIRPSPHGRIPSSASINRSLYPLESAASSLSSFTSYFGASVINTDEAGTIKTRAGTQDPTPIITKAFAPYVPVVSSADANDLARKKGFTSFYDLLRPFGERVEGHVSYRDSAGTQVTLDDFNINFIELGPAANLVNYGQVELIRPGMTPPTHVYLPGGDLVALERQVEAEMQQNGENLQNAAELPIEEGAPSDSSTYYMAFLNSLLAGLTTAPHETFSHPVASCIVISSHNESPIETLVALYKSSSEHLPSYVDPSFLRYYVLIHDEDEHDLEKSLALFARMKNSFGAHCWMLRLSSKAVDATNEEAVLEVPLFQRRSAPERLRNRWAGRSNSFIPTTDTEAELDKLRYIPYVDHTGLVTFVREMVTQSIIPYMERCINLWNEQVAAPRRGLAGRFFKAGRSLWGASRSATPVHGTGNYDPQTSSYLPSTAEAQLRKLADFAFMMRDWRLANSIYDMLRKDYNNDKAWKHHAGAQEMYIITLLLMPGPITNKIRVETIEPTLDSAVYGYLSRCSAPFSALRAMLLTAELLRIRPGGAKDDAAKWIMRAMDSNLVGELTRALLVSRTSACFSTGDHEAISPAGYVAPYTGCRRRKAAFWQVLAAEHWSTIGKQRLARQALRSALSVYHTSSTNSWIAIASCLKLLCTETGLTHEFLLSPAHVEHTAIDVDAIEQAQEPRKTSQERADEVEFRERTITMQTMEDEPGNDVVEASGNPIAAVNDDHQDTERDAVASDDIGSQATAPPNNVADDP
ncbi:hypothetical protein MRB53_039596 [Persea americana]|nr:hypothetical protein MRB53_039596 [Persea americana]